MTNEFVTCNVCAADFASILSSPDPDGDGYLCLMCASGLESVQREVGTVDRQVLADAARYVGEQLENDSDAQSTLDPTAQLIKEYRKRLAER